MDRQFLSTSQEVDKQETLRLQELEAEVNLRAEEERRAKVELEKEKEARKVLQRTLIGAISTAILGIASIGIGLFAQQQRQQAVMDRLIRSAALNAIHPESAPDIYQRLPDYLKRADKNKNSGKIDEAITDYQQALVVANKLRLKLTEEPENYTDILEYKSEIKQIAQTAEDSLALMIRKHRLPDLELELKTG